MMTLTLSCNHGAWDGGAAERMLASDKSARERA
jgi:pyruvate/2-oxoglutarate dehydrogenase complex dihydrolipoamide acyltransferase (E2) component